MECRKYEAQVQNFLDGKLNDEQAEKFILHVQKCDRCYDELEIYFSIYRGIGRSDDRMIEDIDFEFDGTIEDLRDMLGQVLREIEKRRTNRNIKLLIVFIIAVILIAAILILLSEFI